MVSMAHQFLEHWQANAATSHVRAKGMAKPMGIGRGEVRLKTTVPKQTAQTRKGHGLSTMFALEHHEQTIGVATSRSLQSQVRGQNLDQDFSHGDQTLSVSLAMDAYGMGVDVDIVDLEREDFLRA